MFHFSPFVPMAQREKQEFRQILLHLSRLEDLSHRQCLLVCQRFLQSTDDDRVNRVKLAWTTRFFGSGGNIEDE